MREIIIGIILILIHIIICIAIYLGMRSKLQKVPKGMIFVVLFVPFWGALCVLTLQLQHRMQRNDTKKFGIERVQSNKEIYRNILAEGAAEEDEVVPLEEALIVNDSGLRRKLMMDILNSNPEEYARVLEDARMNEDVEVVHYATTAMAELSKEFDLQLQKLENMYEKHPDDEKILNDYCDFLKLYLERNVVTGQIRILQMQQYAQLLSERLKYQVDEAVYLELAKTQIELKDYTAARETIIQIRQLWPHRESVWLLQIRVCAQQGEGKKIQQLIRQMEEQHIYLSARGQEVVTFWKKTEKGN